MDKNNKPPCHACGAGYGQHRKERNKCVWVCDRCTCNIDETWPGVFCDSCRESTGKETGEAVSDLNTYTLWMEGVLATGIQAPASYLGEWPGETFLDACKKWAKDTDQGTLFRVGAGGVPISWGCQIYDNEVDARRQFG